MELSNLSEQEKQKASSILTESFFAYTKSQTETLAKQDKSIRNQKWMMIMLLVLSIGFILTQVYHFFNPSSTEIDRRWIVQQQNNISEQRAALAVRESHDSLIAVKNIADALINLNAQKELSIDKADIAKARQQLKEIQDNAIRKDSLFNQKKVLVVKTVNVNTINTVNTNQLNIKKK